MYKISSAIVAVLAIGSVAGVSAEANNLRRVLGSGSDDECYKCSENDPCGDGDSDFYKHCNKHKYIQCSNGHCYDMHCPEGTVWDEDEETCGFGKAKLGPCGSCEENPCTKQNIKDGKFYHAHCSKKKRYLQCGAAVGVCFEMKCADGTRWDEDLEACESHEGKVELEPCGSCEDNPCTEEALEDGMFYHAHCDKKKKYLQCGARAGMCFERTCGSGTKWDQDMMACVAK